jgi:hypothetical protein
MLTLGPLVTGYVVDLADDNSEMDVGAIPSWNADVSLPCLGKVPAVNFMYPVDQRGLSSSSIQPLEVEFTHVAFSCKDKRPWADPCVNSNPETFAGSFGSQGTSYFHLKLSHPNGQIVTTCDAPWNSWIELDYVKVDQVVKTNCTVPSLSQLQSTANYNMQDGRLDFVASIMHGPIDGTLTEMPFVGGEGGNIFSLTDMLTPPVSPAPPSAPGPPALPHFSGPGELFMNARSAIERFAFGNYYHGPNTLCWSSERGDTMNSLAWHSQCDNRGRTVWMAKITYSGTDYINGGYTRVTWAGNGAYGDGGGNGGIFQISPNLWKSIDGSGPYTGSANAIYRNPNYGPTFGSAHDWYVSSNMITGYSNLGYTYKCRIGNYNGNTCRNDFVGSYSSWSISEGEMWAEWDDYQGHLTTE